MVAFSFAREVIRDADIRKLLNGPLPILAMLVPSSSALELDRYLCRVWRRQRIAGLGQNICHRFVHHLGLVRLTGRVRCTSYNGEASCKLA